MSCQDLGDVAGCELSSRLVRFEDDLDRDTRTELGELGKRHCLSTRIDEKGLHGFAFAIPMVGGMSWSTEQR